MLPKGMLEDISVRQLISMDMPYDMPVTPPKSYCYVSVCKVMHVTMRNNFVMIEVCY